MAYLDALLGALAAHSPVEADDPGRRWAAVAAILVSDPDSILLIRRAERAGDPWSGHMALPGGGQARDDPDLIATAIRETAEEVGIRLERSALAGQLDDIAPTTVQLPRIAVRPYVFHVPERPATTLSDEVAAAAWIELETLLHPETYRQVPVQIHGGTRVVPAYQFGESVVWGMTERILTLLFAAVR